MAEQIRARGDWERWLRTFVWEALPAQRFFSCSKGLGVSNIFGLLTVLNVCPARASPSWFLARL